MDLRKSGDDAARAASGMHRRSAVFIANVGIHGRAIRLEDRGIAIQSRQVQQPQDLNDPKRVSIGAGHCAAIRAVCHLAPGHDRDETAAGLDPHPPQLVNRLSLTPAQIFWIIKHGLRMTGMPAWGGTHSDEELWDLTALSCSCRI